MPQPVPSADLPPLERLREIMRLLRAPGGCPWDREQTHESLLKHLIEEAYEVADAVRSGEDGEIVDELGDLLLQPVFHAAIAEEEGRFTLDDIARAICEKLVRRHPHVFGGAVAEDPEAVLSQWEQIKRQEKSSSGKSVPEPVALAGESKGAPAPETLAVLERALPALMASQKVQKRVARVGFDWDGPAPVLEKVREEVDEIEEAMEAGAGSRAIGEEIGDLLFAVVNLARKSGHEAELLLARANEKFARRFQAVEAALAAGGRCPAEATLEEMETAWEAAKDAERMRRREEENERRRE